MVDGGSQKQSNAFPDVRLPPSDFSSNSGNGIRTRVPALRGLCPGPLDDTAVRLDQVIPTGREGLEPPTAGFGDQCSTS